jgi:hypothetical protein
MGRYTPTDKEVESWQLTPRQREFVLNQRADLRRHKEAEDHLNAAIEKLEATVRNQVSHINRLKAQLAEKVSA